MFAKNLKPHLKARCLQDRELPCWTALETGEHDSDVHITQYTGHVAHRRWVSVSPSRRNWDPCRYKASWWTVDTQ